MSEDFTPAEADSLLSAFKALGAKPKTDRPEDLVAWMKHFVGGLKPEVKEDVKPSPSLAGLHHEGTPRQILSHQLRLPVFTGDGKETSFDLWKYQVTCLLEETHSEETVLQTIRRSLRGEAGRIAMRLGPSATINELLTKMESIYGEVEQKEVMLANFFSARQRDKEDVSDWGCRLEDLLSKATQLSPKSPEDSNSMLRVMFWTGLRDDLKDITAHLYDKIQDFDRLRVAVRRVETDHKHRQQEKASTTQKTTTPCKPAIAEEKDLLQELKGVINQLSSDMQSLKKNQETLSSHVFQTNKQPDQKEHRRWSNQTPLQQQDTYSSQRNEGPRQSYSSGTGDRRQPLHREPMHPSNPSRDRDRETDIVCWRCGQLGHISRGCRVRLDHLRHGLNANRPVQRDMH